MKEKETKDRKYILYIVIVIFVASLSVLGYRVIGEITEKRAQIKEEQRKKQEEFEKQQQAIKDKIQENLNKAEQEKEQREIESFNRSFELYSGTQWRTSVFLLLDKVITNNQKNKEHLIEVKYQNKSYGTDHNKIRTIKDAMPEDKFKFTDYEVSLEYDSKGYVNKIGIERR